LEQPSSITSLISYTLVQMCKIYRTQANRLLNEVGLYVGQEMFWVSLWEEEGLTQTQLAEKLQVQRATITTMLNRMVRDGFMERRPDPDDQRVYRVYLTTKGHALRADLQNVWQRMESQLTAGLSPAEQQIFHRMMSNAIENMNKMG
jgi:MarR family transcriptional regulator, organic hydroperoxide resistance regulator